MSEQDEQKIQTTKDDFEWSCDEQKLAVESRPGRPLLLIGGFGSAKTSSAILHLLALAGSFPGYRVAVLRKTFVDLDQTTRPSFNQWIEHVRLSKPPTKGEIVLDNGSSFIFHHLDRPDSASILKGLEINAAMLDQAEEMNEQSFTILLGRLGRWKGARVPPHVLSAYDGPWPWRERGTNRPVPPVACVLTANPSEEGDPELHWLWQRFSPQSPAYREKWSGLGYRQIIFDSRRNKFISEDNLQILLEQDDDYIARYVRGEWVKSKGQLFSLSDDSILDPDPVLLRRIKSRMNLGRVLDHGDTAPTCCLWFAVDEWGNVFFWQEYYQPGKDEHGNEFSISHHRETITEWSRGFDFTKNLADPSIFDKTRGITGYGTRAQRWSVASEYLDEAKMPASTVIRWSRADNNEMLSRTRIREYLRIDPRHKHPVTGQYGAPHLYFIRATSDYPRGIVKAISETRAAKRLKIGESNGKPIFSEDRDKTVSDHALDCVAPETRLLLYDMRYVPAGDIKVGDALLGFDEHSGGKLRPRHWKMAVVEDVKIVRRPSYMLVFDNGLEVICSAKHQWLSVPQYGVTSRRKWITTEDLDARGHWDPHVQRGKLSGDRRILKPLDVWSDDRSYEAGYLAGIFDGEGCLSYHPKGLGCFGLTMTQKAGSVLDQTERYLTTKGFKFWKSVNHSGSGNAVFGVHIAGGIGENLRFLGSIRPERLLGKLVNDLGRLRCNVTAEVVRRIDVGMKTVVSIQTSTRTYIAEGLASHNCVRYVMNDRVPAADLPRIPQEQSVQLSGNRVVMVLPPISSEHRLRQNRERGPWRSRGGGY